MGIKFKWGLSAPARPQLLGGCSEQPQPHVSAPGKQKLLPPHRWRQHLPQLAKIKLYLWKRRPEPGRPPPDSPAIHLQTGYHGDSILPGRCVPAPLCPKLLELAATRPGDRPAGLVP